MKKTPARFVRRIADTFLLATLFTLVDVSAQAANGTWINPDSGGSWSTVGNWAGGTVANGSGFTANFASIDITADNTVHLNSARTLTGLVFGDTTTNTAAGWVLDNNSNPGNTLTLINGLVTVNPLGGTNVATISVILVGTSSLTKSGSGTLVLSSANTYSSNTIISAGTLTLIGSGTITNSSSVSVASGATFNVLAGGYTVSAGHMLTGAGSVSNGTVTVANGGILAPGAAGVGTLTMSGLSLSGGATNNFEFPASGTNDLVKATSLTLNGGAINLYQAGTNTPFTQPGTYNLFQYSGGLGGVGIGVLSVANPQSGLSYTFGNTGTFITVTITNNTLPASATDISVRSVDGSIIGVHFSRPVDDVTATDTGNYEIFSKGTGTNVFNVTNALLMADSQTVALFLDQPVGEFFAVGVTNVFDINGSNVTATATGYLGDLANADIGDATDPNPAGQVISFYRNVFEVTAGGSDIGGTNDHCHFVYTKASGNFEMVAQITRLDFSDNAAKVCLMARESVAPGSRSVEIGFTPLVPGLGTNSFFMLVRSNTNSSATNFGSPPQLNSLGWLRMTRTNDTFTVYYSTNSGGNWTASGSISQALNGTLSLGVAVASHNNGHTTTADIRNFGVGGTKPGAGTRPTLTVSIVSNNVVAKWQRTPQDFAVQVTDTLILGGTNSTGMNTNDPPSNWAYLMFPVFDTSLTGTNAFMPTAGRYMTIPMDLFSNSQMFVRLTQVERVIPDPINVAAGIVLSQAAQNIFPTNNAGLLGAFSVGSGTALGITNSTYVICPAGKSYVFDTGGCGGTGDPVHTVLQLRKYGSLTAFTPNAGSSTDYKAKITFGTSISITNYTFVVAATNNPAFTSSPLNPIILNISIQ